MPTAALADRRAKFFRALALLLSCGLLLLMLEPVQPARAATTAADDFNRADGSLGSNWTAVSSGGLAVSSQVAVGTSSGGETGDTWTGSSFGGDQFSQITLTSAQLSGGHWIAAMVRAQSNGLTEYAGLYFWNYGNPELMLFKRTSGNWAQLGGVYSSGVLPAGTQLQVRAVGLTISFVENGVQRLSVTDAGITAGAPGIMAYGTTAADNWSGGAATGSATYTVGGSVSGLSGTVVLQDNGGDNLSLSASGPFTFATALAGGTAYNVTVKTNPTGQTCTVSNGTGTIAAANITNVAVSCTSVPTYTVGGSVSGLSGTVVLQDNGGDNLSLSASGPFTFATALAGGTAYNVTVKTNPTGQTCTVSNGTGTIAAANITNVAVSCTSVPTYTVGGSVSGLSGTVVLQDNGGDNLSLSASGPFTFATALAGGTAYNVTVKTNPTGQTCTVSNGTGTIAAANITNVAVSCTSVPTYTVGGSVSGLSGTVVLQDNGGDNLSLSANGPFTFATALAAGTAYTVTVLSNPAAQTCTVSSGSGTIASANVTTVTLTCAAGAADDFNRADGSLGSNWTAVSSGGLAVSSQVAVGTSSGGETGDTWTGSSFGGDQFSQITLTSAQLSGGHWIAAMVRAQSNGLTEYAGLYFWNYGNPELMLFKRTSGNWAQLGGVYSSGVLPAGTQLQVRAVGLTISFVENGVQRLSVTDAGITAGAPGIMAYGTTAADNWSGGAATGSATYTVGGSVSGLSGTVVLQDNGGDNLSLSASGPFTFATALAGGTAYNVTVKTNPTGQTCTVSNGTGTIAAANITNVTVTCTASSTTSSASDDFNRANGSLGPNWTDISDGGLAVTAQAVTGTAASGNSGDIRTGESYDSNQFSQIEVSATQLTGNQWIGPAVRVQAGGQEAYVGIYNWNNGNPNLMLFERNGGSWSQLGTYNCGPLAAGTKLKLMVVGDTIAFLQDGVERIAAAATDLSGGAPGILANGTPQADNWSGGEADSEVHDLSTDANGVQSYDVISANNGPGPQVLRVLRPTNPAPGVAHNFLFVLPVEAGLGSTFGDPLQTLQGLDAQDKYNLTIVEPSFGIPTWYADNPTNPDLQHETFLTQELVPWAQKNLATTGTEQNWLVGFSKSGIGAQDLILRHPGIFTLAASWDFPADISSYNQYGGSADSYGTDPNFQANYRLTPSFVDAHKAPFLTNNRIWIGGYALYQQDMSDYDSLLTSEGIAHSTEKPQPMTHNWYSGWLPIALAALYADSTSQH